MSQNYQQIIDQLEEQQKRDRDFRLGTLYAYAFGMVEGVVRGDDGPELMVEEIIMIISATDEMVQKYYPDGKEEDDGQI